MGPDRLTITLYLYLLLAFAATSISAMPNPNDAKISVKAKYSSILPDAMLVGQNIGGGRNWPQKTRKMLEGKEMTAKEKMKVGGRIQNGPPKISGANQSNEEKSLLTRKVKPVGFAAFSADYRGPSTHLPKHN